MDTYILRRAAIVFVGVFILVAIIVTLANIFGGGSGEPEDTEEIPEVLSVTDYDNSNSEVRYMVEGPIVALEEHASLRISVSADEREIQVLGGYLNDVVKSRSFRNDVFAYRAFLNALEFEGFDLVRQDPNGRERETGVCPSGKRYVSELYDGNVLVQRLWRASCASSFGTLAGDNIAIKNLFIDQIPNDDYRDITRGFRF